MKEKIFNNISLKILSAICAIVLWAVIVNIYDPNTGFTIPGITVQMINTEALTSKDYTYEVVDGSKISVYVRGPKSVITDIKASDIVATADLSKITSFADYVDIDVKVVKDGQTLTNVEVTPKTTAVKLNIENRETQSFNIEFDTEGSVANGYYITSSAISQKTIKITGPSSSMSNIAHAKAICNLNDAQSDIEDTLPIILYDVAGNVINDPNLEMSKQEVDYTATVRPTKEVPIRYSLSGDVASGYNISGVVVNPDKVVIAGAREILDGINEITIPSEAIVIDGLTSSKKYNVMITDYIPNTIKLVSDNYVSIQVNVSGTSSKDIAVKMSDIRQNGLGQGLTASITTKDNLNVKVNGNGDSLNDVTAASLDPYIDLNGLGEGDHSVTVKFSQPSGCSVPDSYTIQVTISKMPPATETNGPVATTESSETTIN